MQSGLPPLPRRCRAVADGDDGRGDGPPHRRLDCSASSGNCGPDWRRPGVERVLSLLRRNSARGRRDRKSTRLNSSHVAISYAVFCLKKKKKKKKRILHNKKKKKKKKKDKK